MKYFLGCLVRFALRLRYRVHIEGLDKLAGLRGTLVLPNHPAQIDPAILVSFFWPKIQLRPMVLEKYYYLPGITWLMRVLRAVPVPDMEAGSGHFKRRRVELALKTAIESLKSGGNVLMYPAGRIMTSGRERLGGASGVSTLLRAAPDANVVLVRTRGLFGSSFSRAQSGSVSPNFPRVLVAGLGIALKNLLFLVPKRKVSITIEVNPPGLPRNAESSILNRWLEEWYNRPGEEAPSFVSRSAWKEDLPIPAKATQQSISLGEVPLGVKTKVLQKLSELSTVPVSKIQPEMTLGESLGLDSLAVASLLSWLDEQFAATDVELAELRTVAALMQAAAGGSLGSTAPAQDPETPSAWNASLARRPNAALAPGATIPLAFLRTAKRMGLHVAMADENSGVLSWRKLEAAVYLSAAEFAKLPGQRVGILLPASCAASISIMGCLIAKKVPVMLNWTAGRKNIEHAVSLAQVSSIVTSANFLDKIDADLSFLEEKFALLEDLKNAFSLWQRIKAISATMLPAGVLTYLYELRSIGENSPAVILFTSGSETAPKAVPLTHSNILSNIAGAMEVLAFEKRDVLYGFLPPFHSFGFTVTTTLPMVSGLKCAFFPNPNESRRIAYGCARWGVSIMAGTPTFLRGILNAAPPKVFDTLRVLVSGAEKAPLELFSQAAQLGHNTQLLEGYGITECSPVVSVGRLNEPHVGVGRPLRGVEILVVNPQDLRPRDRGESGLILIRGPNVFPGYLGDAPSPFVEVDGKRWYNSGDIGFMQEQNLVIAGRLKRFIKIAGEMISLPAIEEALTTHWPASGSEPVLAVHAQEPADGSRPAIFLFTTLQIDQSEANQVLKDAGLPALARIGKVIQIETMPLLGSGKVDLRALAQMASSAGS